MKTRIETLIKKRKQLKNEKQIDLNKKEILSCLKNGFDELECDFILDSLTYLGWAPQLIYDDNGEWAVCGEGFIPVRFKNEETPNTMFNFFINVPVKSFKPTKREAIRDYLFNDDNNIENI